MIFASALVSPAQLAAELGSSGLVLLDCRFNLLNPEAGKQAFLDGHIPGARYADLTKDLAGAMGPATGRHPLPLAGDLQRCLGAWGIDQQSTVVAYDDVGGAIAARAWWLLKWLGHQEAALLDGGDDLHVCESVSLLVGERTAKRHLQLASGPGDLLHRAVGNQLAVVQDRHMVAHLLDFEHVVGTDDGRGFAGVLQLNDQVADLLGVLRVETGGRFIEQDHLRVA